jgi:SAM-dependent methyltransferase
VLEHDNLEEFQDPVDYDLEEVPRSLDRIAFHVAMARHCGGPVLELACGSGICALPIAATGIPVTGVDLAEPMLRHARTKARAQGLDGTTHWHRADAKDVRLPGGGSRFAYVLLTGNAFQAFLTDADQRALLATVRHHLKPGGLFCFETRNPSAHPLRDIDVEEPWGRFIDHAGREVAVGGTQRWDAARSLLHWTTSRRWQDDDGTPRCRTTRIACRFTDVAQLDALLTAAGLHLVERHGGWDRSPLRSGSEHIVSICN